MDVAACMGALPEGSHTTDVYKILSMEEEHYCWIMRLVVLLFFLSLALILVHLFYSPVSSQFSDSLLVVYRQRVFYTW